MKLSEIQLVPEIQALFQENNEYEAIKADIAERGIQDPVKVNRHNQLLAGYTRVKIAQELGLDEVPHVVVDIDGDINARLEYALLDNIRRRQLTDLQLVEYGMKLETIYNGRQGRPEKGGQDVHLFEGKTRDLVADKIKEQTGVKMSGKKYERLKNIAEKAAPEVKQKLNEGSITQKEALEICKIEDYEVQRRILRYSNNESRLQLKAQKLINEKQQKKNFELRCAFFFLENPHLEKYEEAVISGELLLPPEIDGKLKVVSLQKEFIGQEKHFPKYSGQKKRYEFDLYACQHELDKVLARDVKGVPVFSEQEWMEINEYSSAVLEEMFPDFTFDDELLVREGPVKRRTYDPEYGHFFANIKEGFPDYLTGEVYVRREWGTWAVVEFNDGEGNRIKRRFWEQDYLWTSLVEEAFATAHPDYFSDWDYRNLSIHHVQKSMVSWAYIRKETLRREDVIKVLEEDLAKLKSVEFLSDAEIESKAMEILSKWYLNPEDRDYFREGRQTVKRLPNGEIDKEFMDKLCERFHKKKSNASIVDAR